MKDPLERALLWTLALWTTSTVVLHVFLTGSTEPPASTGGPTEERLRQTAPWLGALALTALFSGGALLTRAATALRSGRLRWRFRPAAHGDGVPFLEIVVAFVICGSLVGELIAVLARETDGLWPLQLQGLLILVPFLALLRGVSWEELRKGLGWQRGDGWWREAAWGAVAYLGALPVLTLGLVLSVLVSRWAPPAYHPLLEGLQRDSGFDRWTVVILATVWAPLVEETVFRGAFYTYLRGRRGRWASVLTSGLVFAALHPQGWASWPFLITLASVFAWVREWRGSIVAPVTMHFIHNGIMLTLVTFLMT